MEKASNSPFMGTFEVSQGKPRRAFHIGNNSRKGTFSGPIGAVQSAVLNGFAQVPRLDVCASVEIGDRASNF
jgi:hypothetical protein